MIKVLVGILIGLVIGVLGYWTVSYVMVPENTPQTTTENGDIEEENMVMCAQVITPARNSETGEIREFPTPCDVPEGWEVIQNDVPELDLI